MNRMIPSTSADAQDDEAVLAQIRGGKRRAGKIRSGLGWPLEARYSRLDASLQRLRRRGRIEYRTTGWHEVDYEEAEADR